MRIFLPRPYVKIVENIDGECFSVKKGGNRGPVLVFKADIFDDSFAIICPMGLKSIFEQEAGDGYSGRIKRDLQCTKGHPEPVMSSSSRHSVFTVWQGGRYNIHAPSIDCSRRAGYGNVDAHASPSSSGRLGKDPCVLRIPHPPSILPLSTVVHPKCKEDRPPCLL